MKLTRVIDYVNGQGWCMEPAMVDTMTAVLLRHIQEGKLSEAEIAERIGAQGAENDGEPQMEIVGRVAVVPIHGVLDKYAASVGGISAPQGTSYEAIARNVRAAAANPKVTAIVLDVDSPGGSVGGVEMAAAAIREARGIKPVAAAISTVGASAAYWLAAQADEIYAAKLANVGSIGVYQVLIDLTGAQEKAGVKVEVRRTGPHKGAGAANTAMTEANKAVIDENLAQICATFKADVAAGRGADLAVVETWASGRCWTGGQAMKLGLVDQLGELDSVVEALNAGGVVGGMLGTAPRGAGVCAMKTEGQGQGTAPAQPAVMAGPVVATAAELNAKFAGDKDFCFEQLLAGATMAQAETAWAKREREQLTAEKAKVEADKKALAESKAKLEADAAKVAEERKQVEALSKAPRFGAMGTASADGAKAEGKDLAAEFATPAKEYQARVEATMAKHNLGWRDAAAMVRKENPELHAEAAKPVAVKFPVIEKRKG